MLEADPVESLAYYQNVADHSMFCTHSEIESNVRIVNVFPPNLGQCDSPSNLETIALSLLTRDGGIGSRSGLNWGNARGEIPTKRIFPYLEKLSKRDFSLSTNNSLLFRRTIIKA